MNTKNPQAQAENPLSGRVSACRDLLELGWRARRCMSSKTAEIMSTASQITGILQQHLLIETTYSQLKKALMTFPYLKGN